MPRKFEQGTTIWVYATWTDKDDAAITGITNHTLTITDSAGVDRTGTTPPTVVEVGLGVYYFKYQIAADAATGEWTVNWKVTVGVDSGEDEHYFEVEG